MKTTATLRVFVLLLLVSSVAFAGDSGKVFDNWSTAATRGDAYVLARAMTFSQNFTPQEGGAPVELVVNIGGDCGKIMSIASYETGRASYLYTFSLALSSGGAMFFSQEYARLSQAGSEDDCKFVFPIGTAGAFQKGQPAAFALTHIRTERFDKTQGKYVEENVSPAAWAVTSDNPAFPRASYYNGSQFALRFRFRANTVPVSAVAPANGTIVWDDGSACGTACSQTQNVGAKHTYTVQSPAPWGVSSWGGPCAGQVSPCTVAAAPNLQPISVSLVEYFMVTINRPSTGNTVSAHCGATPCNLDCGSATTGPHMCSANLPRGVGITFTGIPRSGMNVSGWMGCTQTVKYPNKCTISVSGPTAITAYFSSGGGTI